MAGWKLTTSGIFSILVLLGALYYRQRVQYEMSEHIRTVLDSLLAAERKVPMNAQLKPKVAIGFGACLDVITDGLQLLEKVGAKAPDEPSHEQVVNSKEDLENVFAYFFQYGAAAE